MKKLLFFSLFLLAAGATCMHYATAKRTYKVRAPAIAPYITGDNFRLFCDHIIDETQPSFDPSKVNCGDTIFLSGVFLEKFFSACHPFIKYPYILLTHNCDSSVPSGYTAMGGFPNKNFRAFVDDPKIFAWFGQNVDLVHPKLIPIPIGLQNEHWGSSYPEKIELVKRHQLGACKNHLLYGNFRVGTSNPKDRQPLFDYFKGKSFCYFSEARKNLDEYLADVAQSKFVLSPPGNGEDCHRTWEALYLGVYPVVRTSALDQMFADLPVVIIDDWKKINEQFLNDKFDEIERNKKLGLYKMEKITFSYWADLIKAKQDECYVSFARGSRALSFD